MLLLLSIKLLPAPKSKALASPLFATMVFDMVNDPGIHINGSKYTALPADVPSAIVVEPRETSPPPHAATPIAMALPSVVALFPEKVEFSADMMLSAEV